MSLVSLGSGIAVNPEHVVSVTLDFHGRYVLVKDVLGQTHEIGCDYGKSIYDTKNRIEKIISGGDEG